MFFQASHDGKYSKRDFHLFSKNQQNSYLSDKCFTFKYDTFSSNYLLHRGNNRERKMG